MSVLTLTSPLPHTAHTRAVCLAYLRAPLHAAAASLPLLVSLHMHSIAGATLGAVGVLLLALAMDDLASRGTVRWRGLSTGKRPIWWIATAVAGFGAALGAEHVGRAVGLAGLGGSGLLIVLAAVAAYRFPGITLRLVARMLDRSFALTRAGTIPSVPALAPLVVALGVLLELLLALWSGFQTAPRLLACAISLGGTVWLIAGLVAPVERSSFSN